MSQIEGGHGAPNGSKSFFERFTKRSSPKTPEELDPDYVKDPGLRRGLKTTVKVAAALEIASLLGIGGSMLLNFSTEAQAALQKALDFLYDVPSELQLLFGFPGMNEHIKLPHSQLKQVRFYCFGDSMNLNHGVRWDSKEEHQEFSYIQQLVDTVNTKSIELHPDDPYEWEAYNEAVPGASTGNENPKGDDMRGSRQFGNPNTIKEMKRYPGTLVVTVSGNGNDWRDQVSSEAEAVKAKNMIANLQRINEREVDSQINRYKQIKSQVGENYNEMFKQLEEVNAARRKNNLSDVQVIVVAPASYRHFDVVPFAPKGSNDPMPHGTKIGNNKDLRQAFYLITTGIFEELRKGIPKFKSTLNISAISKFGLEEPGRILDKSGHFHEIGQQKIGQRILDILEDEADDGSSQSFTDMGYIIPKPQVTEVVKIDGKLKLVPLAA